MIFTPYTDLGTKQYTIVGLSTGGAMLAAGGLAAGGSLLGGLLGSKGTAPSVMEDTSYNQMVQNGQSGNFNDLANTNSTYLADMFSQLGTGQAPSYYQNYANNAQNYQRNLLNQQTYGTPGNRGNFGGGYMNGQLQAGGPSAMSQAQNMAAIYGLNPQQGIDQMSKVNSQFQWANQALDQYFAGQGLNTIQKTADSLPGWATGQQNSLSTAFDPKFSNMIPAVAGTNPLAGFSSGMGSLAGMYAGMNNGGGYGGGTSSMPGGSMYTPMISPGGQSGQMAGMMASVGGGSPV